MRKTRGTALGLLAVAALLLTACAAPDPLSAGTKQCEDSLQYEIEQALPEPAAGWVDAELTPGTTGHESRDGSEYAYYVRGTAEVQLADGETVTADWECFTQTVDGTTYAAVTRINGECSKTHREALEEAGKTDCD